MRLALVEKISSRYGLSNKKSLIERDIILHEILSLLSLNAHFVDNYLFKGGTCLTKAYVGYTRFSEDLDFTWRNQALFEGKSVKAIRRHLSKERETLCGIFEGVAEELGLDFKPEKEKGRYFMYGGGGRTLTMNLYYASEVTGKEEVVKFQSNYSELLCYPPERRELISYAPDDRDLQALFPESAYFKRIPFDVYALEEILCEKIRSIFTRKKVKSRDHHDVYMLRTLMGMELSGVAENAIRKTNQSLGLYEKYRTNAQKNAQALGSGFEIDWGYEGMYLLKEPGDDFGEMTRSLEEFLRDEMLPGIDLGGA